MERSSFMASMVSLQAYFRKTITDPVLDMYYKNLKQYADEIFAHALIKIFHNFHPSSTVPFPLIADFMEAIGDTAENRAQLAVIAVKRAAESIGSYRSVDFGDPALHATINRFGGWPEIANWANHGKWEFQEKNFMRAYISAYESGEEAPPVMGHFEMDNMKKNEMAFDEYQTKKYIEGKTAVRIQWRGADFSHQVENNKENQARSLPS